jgi:beta-galactosidase
VTVRHNGVTIHDDVELPHSTPGRKGEGPAPRPIHLQEHGNKVDLRWVEVTNNQGQGLRIESMDTLLSGGATPWDKATIESKDYSWQLPAPRATHLNIDHAQMGVGGDHGWGAIAHEPYQLDARDYAFTYRVIPLGR